MNNRDPWLAVDRAHEKAGEVADDHAENLAAATRLKEISIRVGALAGCELTLFDLAELLRDRLTVAGITETLIRTGMSCGPLLAGTVLMDLVSKCIFDGAAAAAEIECGGVAL